MEPGLEAFKELWRLYAEGRVDAAVGLLDPRCELRCAPHGPVFEGHDGFRRWVAESRARWHSLTVTQEATHEVGADCIVATGRVLGIAQDGSRALDGPMTGVLEFRDGLLLRATAFDDADDAMGYAARVSATAP